MTVISKPVLVAALVLTVLGASGVAIATPDFDESPQEIQIDLTASEIEALDDTDRLEQRSGITPLEQVAIAQRHGQVLAFIEFTSAGKRSGILPSRYTGEFFRSKLEAQRTCIVQRESNGRYSAVSPGGRYFGAYQMSQALGVGVTWMMLPEHKELLGPEVAKRLLEELRETPVNEWPRYWQDAAFSTVFNWEFDGSGASHWNATRWGC